jgi:methyl-CpG-binding domain protein 4
MREDLMVQQQIDGPWQHMVGVMMLNLTDRKVVKQILPRFLERWPTPEALLRSRIIDIEEMIQPLGLHRRRAKAIYRMSIDFLSWDGKDATQLHGIGQYGSESYRIFFLGETLEPKDKELKKYMLDINTKSEYDVEMMKHDLIPLIVLYCRSKNLILSDYLQGLFGGLTAENMPKNFLAMQKKYHEEWLNKVV